MTDKFTDSDATRIITALEQRAERRLRNGSQTQYTWGTVGAIDTGNKTASAYIYGETDGAYMSEGFRVPEATFLTIGQKVRVAMNYATGDRWVEEVLYPATAYKKIAIDLATGRLMMGDGTVAPTATIITDDLTVLDDVTLAAGSVLTWAGDTNLYRSAADTLKTDDTFEVASLNLTGVTTNTGFTINNGGTATFGSKELVWSRVGPWVFFRLTFTVTAGGSGGTTITVTGTSLPDVATGNAVIPGDRATTGVARILARMVTSGGEATVNVITVVGAAGATTVTGADLALNAIYTIAGVYYTSEAF